MAHFALLWKARTIEKYRQNYENEKINSIMMSRSDVPDKTLFQRWRHYKHGMQKRLSRTFSNWYPEGSTLSNFFVNLGTDMKLPNILLRSLYGFIGGLLLTYLGFMFFVFQLSVSLIYATILSSIIGVLLTLGLTFSNRMRCLIFLLVPQLFSRVGRYTLTCYALVLILTGPATNTLKNSEVLSESMACSQEQIKLNVKQINDSIKKPFNSIKDALKTTIKRLNFIVRKLKIALIRTNKLILNIASTIQSGYSWLRNMADSCNDALGTPHDKCLTLLKEQCEKCEKHYVLNDIEPKNIKRNKNFIRNILHAIGIKNVKKIQEDNFGFNYFKKDKEKGNHFESNVKGINHTKYTKGKLKGENTYKAYAEDSNKSIDKDAKRDNKRYSSSENIFLRENDEKRVKPWFCNPDSVAKSACASLLPYEKFCVAADFTGDTFLTTIRQKLKTFIRRISAVLHAQVNIQHTYTYLANCSSSLVTAGIVTEIRNRADPLLTWLSWSSCVTSLFLLLIIFRAKHYQHMFETRSRFDNRFITKEFRELDLKRLREGRETVLPLNTRERAKYVTTTSFRLVTSEKVHLNRSAVFMTVATFKLLIHIVADYSLFWVLTTIRHHGKLLSPLQPDITDTRADISGSGYVARLLQAFIDTMNLQLSFPPPEYSCLPNPYPPDIKRYCQIGFLIFLLWFFALFEPYGLRMRHLIMGHNRPRRAKDRAVWLYNHILRTRASFMKYARRKLHREYKYSAQSKLSLREYLRNHMLLRWLSSLLGIKPEQPHCLLCNVTEDSNGSNKELIKCEVPNCPGIYCGGCFLDIGQLCTICLSPADYGDFSDVSMENGSSDEDNNDKDPEDDNSSRSYKRNSNSDFYILEDADSDNDGANSKRCAFSKRRPIGYFFGSMGNRESDTIPLLKHSVKRNANYEVKEINKFTDGVNAKTGVINKEFLTKNTNQRISMKKNKINYIHNFKDTYDNHTQDQRLSAIDILLFSLYKITSNPLHIVKSEYTTSVAKYLRTNKLIRHKKCHQKYSKYFMTCSNTNINKNEDIKNFGDIRDQDKNFKKTKKNARNNPPKKVQKCSFNDIEIEKVETKNEEVLVKNTKHKKTPLRTGLSKYWRNVIKTVLTDKSAINTKENRQPKEWKPKRKKKRKKTKITLKNLKPKEKAVLSSRIFAYLDDRDWANCGNETHNTKKDREIHTTKGEIALINNERNHKIVVNDILIPRLDLNLSSDSITISQLKISNETKIISSAKRKDGKLRFGRFFNTIACSSCELLRTSLGVNLKDDLHSRASEPYLQIQESIGEESPGSIHYDCKEDNLCEDVTKIQFARLPKPLLVLKSRCSSLFLRKNTKEKHNEKPKNDIDKKNVKLSRETQTIAVVTKTDEKQVSAQPQMTSRGCQKILRSTQTQDFAVQVKVIKNKNKKTCICKDANIMTDISICSKGAKRDIIATKGVNLEMKKMHDNLILEDDINLDTSSTRTSNYAESNAERTICSYANIDYKNTCFDLRKDLLQVKDRDERSNNQIEKKYEHVDKEYDVRNKYQIEMMRDKFKPDDQVVIPNYKVTRVNNQDKRVNGQSERLNDRDRRKNNHKERMGDQFELDDHKVATVKDQDGRLNCQGERLNKRERIKAGKGNLNNQSGPCNEQGERLNDQSGRLKYQCGRINDENEIRNENKKHINSPFGKLKISVVTKSNQSTLTDKMTHCDVSTATNDWWSPLVERRSFIKKTNKTAEKRRRNCGHSRVRERQTYRNKGIPTGEKNVTFKSKTQLIPSMDSVFGDIMSPARYLLESQKYYNELFYNIFASPRVHLGNNIQKKQYSERERTQISSYHYRRKGRKIKRLEESYSPRKDVKLNHWMKGL